MGGAVGDVLRCVGLIDQRFAVTAFGSKPRPGAYAVDLTLDQALRIVRICVLKGLKFDARRTGIDDKDRIHGTSSRWECCFVAPGGSIKDSRRT